MFQAINEVINTPSSPTITAATLTSSATLIGAFVGAGLAQYFSHRLTIKRENVKSLRESYQKLFAPIITDVYEYYNITTFFRKGDLKFGTSNEGYLDRIFSHIGKNLMYATPELIAAYNEYKFTNFVDDNSGFGHDIIKLNLIRTFINELLFIADSSDIFTENTKRELVKYSICYYLWMEFTRFFNSFERASKLLGYDFYLDFNLSIKNSKQLIENYEYNQPNSFDRTPMHLIKLLLEDNKEEEIFIKLIEDLQNNNTSIKISFLGQSNNPDNIYTTIHNCRCVDENIHLELEVTNFSSTQKTISLKNFYIQNINKYERSIPASSSSKGFRYNNIFQLDQIELFGDNESEKLMISFQVPKNSKLSDYILYYVTNGKKYEIQKLLPLTCPEDKNLYI
ncbi:hypothetical protein J2T17_004423 [Paenibacillus mucilaginosus]|uniref:hypothetical protein n=1 Tax=Paenibacillus mucilaginosus TaxID=61624 RepID=UPI003D21DDA2